MLVHSCCKHAFCLSCTGPQASQRFAMLKVGSILPCRVCTRRWCTMYSLCSQASLTSCRSRRSQTHRHSQKQSNLRPMYASVPFISQAPHQSLSMNKWMQSCIYLQDLQLASGSHVTSTSPADSMATIHAADASRDMPSLPVQGPCCNHGLLQSNALNLAANKGLFWA